MGIKLARRGRESFVIIEQADDVGGTWRDNRYPGVSCDIPSHLYSFSFRPNPHWSRVFAEGREIHAYLRACVAEEGLEDHLRLNCALSEAQWSDDDARWLVRTTRGDFSAANLGHRHRPAVRAEDPPDQEPGRVRRTVVALGPLEREGVAGRQAGRADRHRRLGDPDPAPAGGRGQRGRGLPASAPYVLPRGDREYSREEMERFAADPGTVTALRDELFAEAERGLGPGQRRHPDIDLLRQRSLDHLTAEAVPIWGCAAW